MKKSEWTRHADKLLADAPKEKRRILRGMLLAIYDEVMQGKQGKMKARDAAART